jgi:flavin reductase (DIM6/NTAB) family NADH-FMN oxidoreductase RutF
VTAVDVDGGLRGITATSVMVVSQDPAVIAVALTASGSFHRLAEPSAILGISILEADHEFMAERFAGRAPVPDAGFAGVPHRMAGDVPILDGALGWCQGPVWSCEEIGDHVLVLVDVTQGDLGPDTDDPLLSYEGRYRRLEAG